MHQTERVYEVTLVRRLRPIKGRRIESVIHVTVSAVSTAQAMRKAEADLPGWAAINAA